MDYETIKVERRGAELRITLDRPDAMNAWNNQFGLDLRDAVEQAADRRRRARRRGDRRRAARSPPAPT